MVRRGTRATATAVALFIPLVAAAPASAAGDRQTVSLSLTTTVPGAPSGNRFSIQWRNPADPSAKPPAVDTMIFHLPRGTRYDFSVLPQCKASDAELMVRGTAGCPAQTWVSNGRVVTDTGSPGVFPRFINVRTTMFNNQDEMIGVGESEELPFRTVTRTKYQGERVTLDMPDNPGGPPDNRTAFKSLETVMSPIVRNGRSYARTPPTCPVSGFWTFRSEFIYHDGVRQIETTRAPCRRSANPCLANRSGISRRGIARIPLGRSRAQKSRSEDGSDEIPDIHQFWRGVRLGTNAGSRASASQRRERERWRKARGRTSRKAFGSVR
jgi:hypothetical protein